MSDTPTGGPLSGSPPTGEPALVQPQNPTGAPRRAVLRAGLGAAAVAGLGLAGAGTAEAHAQHDSGHSSDPSGAGTPKDTPTWQSYLNGPTSRTVPPVRVHSTAGDVADADALLAPGGSSTVLTRPQQPEPPRWPEGTTAQASSSHAPNNGDDGRPRGYDAANAIDADPGTFWNDDTIAAYPDTLTVTAPAPLDLPGVTVLSNSDGVPQDFTVETWDGAAWQQAATVTGNTAVRRAVPFARTVSTSQVRITVTRDQSTQAGEFTRINEVYPGVLPDDAVPYVVVDFGKVVVGYPHLRFSAASDNHPGIRLAFSETLQYLTDSSDFTRSGQAGIAAGGTDQYAVPAGGADWQDTKGYQSGTQVHADGLHGFRYLRISLDALPADAPAAQPWGTVAVDAVWLDFTAYLGTADSYAGWFLSSDDDLNRYWYGAAYTNELVTDTFRSDDVDPRGADSPSLDGKLVLHDGAKRDRDPYVGDLAVSARTLYLTHPDAAAAARDILADLADHQRADGWIPPASINGYTLPLFDYPLWWVTCGWDYVLYTGDQSYAAACYPHLTKLLDGWCPSVTDADGLLSRGLNGTSGYGDYAFLGRTGQITYDNSLYVRALGDAASLATLLGQSADAARWTARATAVAAAVNAHLWDADTGAYLDSTTGDVRHAQDGNALAITAGVADPGRAASALAHLDATTPLPYGNAFMDNDTLFTGASQRVYAFTSYPELVARFTTGRADSALDQIRRTYGWMDRNDPGTTHWEAIGPDGSLYEGAYTSMAHGWSTGVLPALTNELLGIAPTAPGFARWTVAPRPGSVAWARGQVGTPNGPVSADWQHPAHGTFTLTVRAPLGTRGEVSVPTDRQRVTVAVDRRQAWNGRSALAHAARDTGDRITLSELTGGTHTITVRPTR